MRIEDFKDGQRVRIIRMVDLSPYGRYAVGLLGTIEDCGEAAKPRFKVKLDKNFPLLDRWNNRLYVWNEHHECSASDFEAVFTSGQFQTPLDNGKSFP